MSDDTTCTAWQPTEKQRAVLAAFQDKGYDCPVEEACEAAGVSRRAYYYWHDDPQFSQWWAEQSNRHFRLELHRVHAATFKAATGKDAPGGSRDRRLYYERFDKDYCPASRSQREISGRLDLAHHGATDPSELCKLALTFLSARTAGQPGMTPAELERLAHATDDDPPITSR